MILATKIQSEKGKEITKTANNEIIATFTVNRQVVATAMICIVNGKWLFRAETTGEIEHGKHSILGKES